MKIIDTPELSESYVLEKCISGIGIRNLQERLNEVTIHIIEDGVQYKKKAKSNELHTFIPVHIGNDEIALGQVTKKELINLYTNYLVGKNKPGREVYDTLMKNVPLFRCPFCGLNHISTLDHFLPKTKFPSLSIIPTNLVPSCKDCNTGKSSTVARIGKDQPLHPYFDRKPFHTEQWLFASVTDSQPMTVTYHISPPYDWSFENKSRVKAHFNEFNLFFRYSIEAASELSSQQYIFNKYIENREHDSLLTDLEERSVSYERQSINSWQTALYKALAEFYRKKFPQPKYKPKLEKKSDIVTCPRCLGEKKLLGLSCDACNGVGAASVSHFAGLGDSVYGPVICDCPDGLIGCKICNSNGKVDLTRARRM